MLVDGGSPIEVRNRDGLTPLHLAIVSEYILIVTFLLARGADATAPTDNGSNVYHLLAQSFAHSKHVPTCKSMLRALARTPADPLHVNKSGMIASDYLRSLPTYENYFNALLNGRKDKESAVETIRLESYMDVLRDDDLDEKYGIALDAIANLCEIEPRYSSSADPDSESSAEKLGHQRSTRAVNITSRQECEALVELYHALRRNAYVGSNGMSITAWSGWVSMVEGLNQREQELKEACMEIARLKTKYFKQKFEHKHLAEKINNTAATNGTDDPTPEQQAAPPTPSSGEVAENTDIDLLVWLYQDWRELRQKQGIEEKGESRSDVDVDVKMPVEMEIMRMELSALVEMHRVRRKKSGGTSWDAESNALLGMIRDKQEMAAKLEKSLLVELRREINQS